MTNECTAITWRNKWMSTYNMEKTNECTAITWRNKWMSTYNMEKH